MEQAVPFWSGCTSDETKMIEQIVPPMSSEERHNARQAQSKPVLEDFYAWLDTLEVSVKTALAKAVPQPSWNISYAVVK